jgi:hypothetical protein
MLINCYKLLKNMVININLILIKLELVFEVMAVHGYMVPIKSHSIGQYNPVIQWVSV